VRCIIKPEFPNERVRNHALASQASNNLSKRRLMEDYYNVQQPDLERQQMLQEAAETHPLVQQYAMIQKFQEMADQGDEAAAMALQAMQQSMNQAAQNQGGRPNEPPNPSQPLGVQSPTGSPLPSSQVPGGQEAMNEVSNMANAAPQMTTGEVQ